MLTLAQILRARKVILQQDYGKAYLIADQLIQQELPREIKLIIDEAFPGPTGIGYRDPFDLLEVVTFIARETISITKYKRDSIQHPLPKFYCRVHHDRNDDITDDVIGIIAQHIGPFGWETDVDWFDALIYRKGKPYAYVEVGWIKPHKVRNLIYDREVRQLWLFPYSKTKKALTPYYFVIKRASNRKCWKIQAENIRMHQKWYAKIFH